jgi:transposase
LRKGGFLAHRNPEGNEMRQKSGTGNSPSERLVKGIRRATRKQYSAEEKSRMSWTAFVANPGLPSCAGRKVSPRGFITAGLEEEFLEAGERRLAGDTARAATSSEVTDLRREARALKEVVAEQALELRLLKKA